jgi:hypothetical protein
MTPQQEEGGVNADQTRLLGERLDGPKRIVTVGAATGTTVLERDEAIQRIADAIERNGGLVYFDCRDPRWMLHLWANAAWQALTRPEFDAVAGDAP